jgi:hypothetical protein
MMNMSKKKAQTIRSLLIQFFEERGQSQQSIDRAILGIALTHPGELDEIVPQKRVEEFSRCLWSAYGETLSMSKEQIARQIENSRKKYCAELN